MSEKSSAIYVSSMEPGSGKLMVSLGLMELMSRTLKRVGFFRPVVSSSSGPDNDLKLIFSRYKTAIDPEKAYCFSVETVQSLGAQGKFKEILRQIIERYHILQKEFDFIIIEGFESSILSSGFDLDANLEIARNLGAGFVGVLNAKSQNVLQVVEEIKLTAETIEQAGCFHLATIVNMVPEVIMDELKSSVIDYDQDAAPVYFIPEIKELSSPTIGEIKENLGCRLLYGSEKGLERIATQFKVAAMTLDNYLSYLENSDLIITPGDREDVIVGTLATLYSKAFPNIAGILLTGGLTPGPRVENLIEGLGQTAIPILSVETDTFTAAMEASKIKPVIKPEFPRKIDIALGVFEDSVNISEIRTRMDLKPSETMTPLMFQFRLFEWARREKKRIVLPESLDERILKAVEILKARAVVDITLIGNKEQVLDKAAILGVELRDIEIVDHVTSPYLDEFSEKFYEMRKKKGITRDAAQDTMLDPNYFGVMMVHTGLADGMVSGAQHATQDVLRPAFQIIRTRPDVPIASSVFFMCLPQKVLVFGDCAVNPDPDSEQLATIAISSADTARDFGIDPRVAMLSYSTGSSGKGEEVEKVKKAVEIARRKRPDLLLDGPLQYDAAVDPVVAQKKAPNSKVAGRATVLIFPDLNTGNNTYKAVQRSSGAVAVGPVIQGLKKPVNDLSRGCLVEDVVNTVAITAIQAQNS